MPQSDKGLESQQRRLLLTAAACSVIAPVAHAGKQAEEPLIDSVRGAMSGAIKLADPPEPRFRDDAGKERYTRWLLEMSQRLASKKTVREIRLEFLQTLWYESQRAGLEPALVLGLVQVESNFRKHAISIAGARGYMQVMPFWVRLIGDGDVSKLFHMQTNLRFGCVILRHYLDIERGDMWMALGRYNGSRGKPEYPNAVYAARVKWLYQ